MARAATCPFCRIVDGTGPAQIVYEDPTHVAFLDRRPINPGHLLVIPRHHYETMLDMPSEEVGALFTRVAELARGVKKALKADGVNIGTNSGRAAHQLVPHMHVHIIPRHYHDSSEGTWPSRKDTGHADLEGVAQLLRREVGKKLG